MFLICRVCCVRSFTHRFGCFVVVFEVFGIFSLYYVVVFHFLSLFVLSCSVCISFCTFYLFCSFFDFLCDILLCGREREIDVYLGGH